jgi:hypothetical protein
LNSKKEKRVKRKEKGRTRRRRRSRRRRRRRWRRRTTRTRTRTRREKLNESERPTGLKERKEGRKKSGRKHNKRTDCLVVVDFWGRGMHAPRKNVCFFFLSLIPD